MSRRRAHGDTASPGVLACGRRSCMTEAAPDSLYCPQHAREIVLGLEECRVAGCDERVPFGSLHCAEHAELRRLGRLSVTGEAVPRHLWPVDVPPAVEPVTSIRLVPPPEPRPRGGAHAVPELPTAEGRPFEVVPRTPTCRKCDRPVREGGARAGRYGNLCVEHYDEQRALTSEACKRSTPGRRIGGSEPRREEPPVPEPTPVDPPPEDPTPDAPELDRPPLPEIGAALRREGVRPRALRSEPLPELPPEGPIGGAYERMIDAQLVTSVEVFPEPSPAERVLEAYAVAIADALSAWGCELTLAESRHDVELLAAHAERLLALGPGVRAAVELLAE